MCQPYTYIGNEPCNQEWFSCVGKVFHKIKQSVSYVRNTLFHYGETLCFECLKHFVSNA